MFTSPQVVNNILLNMNEGYGLQRCLMDAIDFIVRREKNSQMVYQLFGYTYVSKYVQLKKETYVKL